MMKLSPTYAALVASVIVAALSLCAPVFFYLRILSDRAYVAQVQDAIAQDAAKENQERALKQRALLTAPLRAELERASIDKDAAASFIGEVEATARGAKVSLDIGTVDIGGESVGRLKTLILQARVEGAYGAVMKFLQMSETFPEATSVRSVSLERRDKTWVLIATLVTPIKTAL